MALLTPQVIARRALATLYNTTLLAGLVYRDYDQDFAGKAGDTITVRTPATFTANVFDRAAGITLQDPNEGSIPVTLDTILDVSFPVTAEELTLEIDDFATRLLNPAMEAIVQNVDGRIAKALVAAARSAPAALANGDGAVPSSAYREARSILSRKKISLMGRNALLAPEAVSSILGEELVAAADKSGSTDALREAYVGRLFGFDNYESQVLTPGTGTTVNADGVAFTSDAVALVSRTLQKPMGVAPDQVAIENYQGLGLRVVRDYDIDKKQDVISVDFLLGVNVVRDEAVVELDIPTI